MTSKIIIIIPVYNEQGNIKPILKGIFHHLKMKKAILFINDNSQDRTQLEIKEYQKKYKNIFLENRKSKLGIGSAHKFGFKWALKRKYRTIVTMDCDGTHNPKYINQMINLLAEKDYDIVSTNRFLNKNSLNNWSLWRKLLTKLRHLVIKNLFNTEYDSSGAFRCYNFNRVKLKDLLLAKNNSYSFFWQSMIILNQKKYRINEIAINLPARSIGSSKMELRDIVSALLSIFFFYLKN